MRRPRRTPTICGRIFYDAFASIADAPQPPGRAGLTRVHALRGRRACSRTRAIAGLVAERDGEVLGSAFVDERWRDRRNRPGHRRPGGAGRRRRPGADGGRAATRARPRRRRRQARPDRLPLPLARAVREARLRRPRAALGPPGNAAAARHPRPRRPARARGRPRRVRRALYVASTATTETASCATPSRPARRCVVERPGRISGYATGFGYGWHAVAETNEDMIALLGSAESVHRPRHPRPVAKRRAPAAGASTTGCASSSRSTLMTIGLYNEPAGAWLPSIVY